MRVMQVERYAGRIEKVLAGTAAQCSGEEVPECPVLEALAS